MAVHTVKAFSGMLNLDTSCDKFTGMNKTLFAAYSARVDTFVWLIKLNPEIIMGPTGFVFIIQ